MSMDSCAKCGELIDTDVDMECYREAKRPNLHWEDMTKDGVCLCPSCRPDIEDEYEREQRIRVMADECVREYIKTYGLDDAS